MNTRQGYWTQNIMNIQDICNWTSFNVEYRQFIRNFSEITDNIKSLQKRHKDVKQQILQFQNQYGVIFLLKTNALTYWWTVMVAWKKQITENFLESSRWETKICNKKLQKVVFTGTERSLLADITNILVKALNSFFKKVFNENFTSQLKPNSIQIQEVLHGTAKTITKNIENKWDERVVETKSVTSAKFLILFSSNLRRRWKGNKCWFNLLHAIVMVPSKHISVKTRIN